MFLSQFWVQKLGWTLLHFLWQGTATAVVYAVLRRLLARSLSAQGRYVLACAALVAMAVAPALTFPLIPNTRGTGSWTISAAESQRLLPAVVALWMLGVLAFSIRLLGGWRFAARLRSTALPAPPEWQQTLERIATRVGAKRAVRLMVSSLVDIPTVIGWLRPVILVPVEFLTGLSVEHITALLAHEIAHIRRHDYLASILQSIAEAVLFYHPAVWWISVQIRAERELCCDDLAVAVSGDALAYAQALAELEWRQPARLTPVLAANGGSLVNRIRRLIEPANTIADSLPGPAAAWAMILLWAAGVGVATIHGAQTPTPKPPVVSLEPSPAAQVTGQPSPFTALETKARKTLLFDPFFSAQLAQTQGRGGDQAEPWWRNWLNEDAAYIITSEERSAFLQLITDEEREQFIEQFWLRRDPTPDTIANEFKEEHYRRFAYANEHFSSGIPGWKTDRGRIYITYGPPDEVMYIITDAERNFFRQWNQDAHPPGGVYQPPAPEFEDWQYRYIEGIGNNVDIEFVDARLKDALKFVPYQRAEFYAALARLERLAQLQQAPPVKFKELDDAIGKLNTYAVLPMQVRIDYVRVTESSVMANISVQFENRDLQFQFTDGAQKATVNLPGRISTLTRRPVTTFERPLEINAPGDMPPNFAQRHSVFQQSVPLAPGRYRLNIVAKDTVSGNLNNYEVALDVPHFDDKLASSSLILADMIEKQPAKSVGGGMFSIGGTKVRPRLGNKFTGNEKIGIYLQLYNFGPDPVTQKPSGSIEYEIDKAGSNEKVMDFSEDVGSIANASASQMTIEKMLPLNSFAPGNYTIRVKATDKIRNEILQQQGTFTVSVFQSRDEPEGRG